MDLTARLGWPQPYVSRYETSERLLDLYEHMLVVCAIWVDPVKLLEQALASANDRSD